MGRALRTRFDMLCPNTEKKVCDSQAKQKQRHDEHTKERSFSPGQTVWARDFRGSTKWVPGVVVQCTGPLTYMIQLDDKSLWKRHVDHLQSRVETQPNPSTLTATDDSESSDSPFIPIIPSTEPSLTSDETSQSTTEQSQPVEQQNTNSQTSQVPAPRRNPSRNRHPPKRFQSAQT